MTPEPPIPRVDLISRAGIGQGYPPGFVPRCPGCGYDLTGLSQNRCPECGRWYTIPDLIRAWRERQASRAQAQDADALGAGLLAFVALFPTNLFNPASVLWKLPVLVGLWWLTAVWYRRRAEELREPTEGHRLMWVWIPCISTAAGLLPTPVLGQLVSAAMLVIGTAVTVVAFRRSPVWTASIVTLTLAIPVAIVVVMAVSMVTMGLAGLGRGHHWSVADFPSWYWRGVPGRVRGMNNREAVRIGTVILVASAALLAGIVGMWVVAVRGVLKRRGRRAAEA